MQPTNRVTFPYHFFSRRQLHYAIGKHLCSIVCCHSWSFFMVFLDLKSTDKLNDMLNTMKFIKLYRNHLKSISLTCSAIPLRLSKVLPEVLPCKLLQSLLLTNFKCTLPQVRKILKLPALSELHLLSYAFGCNLFEEVAFSKCKLKLLLVCEVKMCHQRGTSE